jgi:2'-5' RNA ligase
VTDERVRLFVALELPEDVREAIVEWRRRAVGNVRGLRLVAPESLHVTLCFLGWRFVSEIDAIVAACAGVPSQPGPRLLVADAIWLPPRRPGVLAVKLDDVDGALGGVQRAFSDALESAGFYTPEKRPFLPHVTVGRVRRGARIRAVDLPAPRRIGFDGASVALFRSRPMTGGSRYEALLEVALAAPATLAGDRLGERQQGEGVGEGFGDSPEPAV